MFRKTARASCLSLILVGFASGSAQSLASQEAEAPVAIRESAGEWVVHEDGQRRSRFARRPSLSYQARVFPRLSVNLLRFECEFPGGMKIEVTGLIPAQRFPQPAIALRIGGLSWSKIPNALYHSRSLPISGPRIPDAMLDDNLKGANLSWPGHPAYAALSFFNPADASLVAALRSGEEIQVAFDGQQRRFPAVPAQIAERFARACTDLGPPQLSVR